MAVLFSGGLDSMILAALLNECLDPSCKCCCIYFPFFPLKCFVYDYLNKCLLFVTFPRFMELIIEQHVW